MNDVRGIGTLLVMAAFISVCVWAYSSKRKKSFDEAANLPFVDDEEETAENDKNNTNSQQEKQRNE